MRAAPTSDPVMLPANPALDAVTDADRAWLEAHPCRRYHLRPTAIVELMPGESMRPGSHTVVARCGSPLVRMRVRVGCPPARLRRDTDRCCEDLLRRLDAAGFTISDMQLGEVLAQLRQEGGKLLGQASPP